LARITKDWRDSLHAYVGGIVKNLGGVTVTVGGIEDHAHLLIESVKRYILNQEEHHRHKSFEEEYLEMLKLAGIEYDERYVW